MDNSKKKSKSKEVSTPPDFYTNSIASSSRMASAASAPVTGGRNDRRNTKPSSSNNRPSTAGNNNMNEMRQQQRNETNSGTATPIPSIANSNNTPTRIRSRRELEHKIRNRQGPRAVPTHSFVKRDTDKSLEQNKNEEEQEEQQGGGIPLPKALTDILLQTAIFGIDTTARLSKPTLQLTKDTLLPQIIIPLIIELFQQYVPTRLQHWIKVLPTSIKNVMSLLWDTNAGQNLGNKTGQLTENILDMISSDVARQCFIDVTISIIKFMESLHTPEVKLLLDQFAVGACRVVDVLSSGKAKQVWFDVSDSLWALIEVGSDPVMVTSLAEGCAQVCFALENERESLKVRRATAGADEEGGNEKLQKMMASKRRRERDKRQTGTYPPGKAVLGEGEGRDGFAEALLDGLDGHRNDDELHDNEDEVEAEGYYYGNIDEGGDDGPPQRVLVPTSSTENISFPDISGNIHNEGGISQNEDDESEITTEIEDLGGRDQSNRADFDEVDTQSSASGEKNQNTDRPLAYELLSHSESIQNQTDQQVDWNPNGDDDGTAQINESLPDQPILQFYRRLNEVLVEHRKQGSNIDELRHTRHKEKQQYEENLEEELKSGLIDTSLREDITPLLSKKIFGLHKRWWKVIIIASLFGIVTMCMLWFALGCYGFYVLVIGGNSSSAQVYHPPNEIMPQQPPVVIQIVTQASPQEIANQCDDATADNEASAGSKYNRVSTISLDDWQEMKLGVDQAIEQATTEEQNE